ncbi:hypothetical protein [Listeria costaricensis]|uniref:hypothetical protein n=1 Tax=Listeria costaricensis TaxID=2026604 RepID=UPI000C0731E7|nr:hypothetical protein [Listeria costaricensis]
MALIIEGVPFELDTTTRNTAIFIFENLEGQLEYALDCSFKAHTFHGDHLAPSLCINPIKTTLSHKEALTGARFSIANINESQQREDTFYFYEHEPLENYTLTILKIDQDIAHIKCSGTAIIDGFTKPYTTGKFDIDCLVPVITKASDWQKWGL